MNHGNGIGKNIGSSRNRIQDKPFKNLKAHSLKHLPSSIPQYCTELEVQIPEAVRVRGCVIVSSEELKNVSCSREGITLPPILPLLTVLFITYRLRFFCSKVFLFLRWILTHDTYLDTPHHLSWHTTLSKIKFHDTPHISKMKFRQFTYH